MRRWISEQGKGFSNYITGRAGVSQPNCGDEQAVREGGVTVTSSRSDRIKWCFGLDQGERLVKVSNNTGNFEQMSFPAGWKVVGGLSVSMDGDTAARAFGSTIPAEKGTHSRIVDGGDTLTLRVPAGEGGVVHSEVSTLA